MNAHRENASGKLDRRAASCALGLLVVLAIATPAGAQLNATVTDIGPNTSTLDATNPNGASGGRVGGLAVHPGNNTTFYAASEWGGIFRTTDGGNTWVHLAGHLPHATWDVEVDPGNGNRVFATSFYDGRVNSQAGIQISQDGGNTWTRANATPPVNFCLNAARRTEPSAFGIAVDPDTPARVYAGTNCGLARSTNSGAAWDFVDPTPGDPADDIWDVVVHDGGIIDLCGDDGHQRSIDGGANWTTVTAGVSPPGGQCSIAASPDEAYVLFVLTGATVWESDDAGATWPTTSAVPGAQGRIPFVVTNDRTGAAFDLWVSDTQLFRAGCTTPTPAVAGGAARCPSTGWTNAQAGAHWDAGDLVFDSQAANDACPRLYSNDGGVFRNTLAGSPGCHAPNWAQPATATPHAVWVWDLSGSDQGGAAEDLYFVNQDTGTFSATNAPANPPAWNNRDCCDGFDSASDPNRVVYSLCCFNAGIFNRLFVRNSGMTGGGQIATYPPGNVPSVRQLDSIDNFGPDDYVIAMSGGVFVTLNITAGTITWTQLGAATSPANACNLQAATLAGNTSFFVKSGACNGNRAGSLWRYDGTAAGGAWQQILRNGLSQFGVVAVDPNDGNRIVASDLNAATGPEMVWSIDSGANWQALPELDQAMQGAGTFRYNSQRGPVVTGPGTASMGFNGYPQPTLVAFDPEDGNILVAGAADAGVFVSADRGEDWHRVTDPNTPAASGIAHVPRPIRAYFDHEPANRVNVYLGTQGRGAWRVSFFRPPIADAGGPYTTNEGTPITVTGTGADAEPGPLTFAWDLDSDGAFDDGAAASAVFPAVQNGNFVVRLRVTDADGAQDTDEATVVVLNVPPTVTAGPDVLGFEDDPIPVAASFTDPGVLDTHTATVDWGDGTPVLPAAVVQGAGSGTVAATHVYPDPGVFTATITVTDSDGGAGSDTLLVTVVHGFLKYCAFGEGTRDRLVSPDGTAVRGATTDCAAGALARVRVGRRGEVGGDLLSVDARARIGGKVTGKVRVGDRLALRRGASVTGDASARSENLAVGRGATLVGNAAAGGQVVVRSGGTVTGTVTSGAVIAPHPPITLIAPALTAGGADVSLGRGEVRALAPGSYGRLRARRGAVLDLAAGHYHFSSVRLARGVTVRFTGGPVILDAQNGFRFGRNGTVTITGGDASGFLVQVGGDGRLRLGRGGDLRGTYLAPRRGIGLGRGAVLEGALYGRKVRLGRGAELRGKPAIGPIVSLYL